MEVADKLMNYRNNREPLVAAVHMICKKLGYTYLQRDQYPDGSSGPIKDICPFTTIGVFNRTLPRKMRQGAANHIGEFLDVFEFAPDSFDGIPTLNPHESKFFRWAKDRGDDDIELLWQVFEDALKLADSNGNKARQSFESSYDAALELPIVSRNLTVGLFWIRPQKYPTLDAKSTQYIGSGLGVTLPNRIPPQAHEYLNLADRLSQRFAEVGSPVRSFQELSLKADEPTTENPISPVWLVRVSLDDQHLNFEHDVATIGWPEVRDLRYAVDLNQVWAQVHWAYPHFSNQKIGQRASQLFSFVREMREGDIVVVPMQTVQRSRHRYEERPVAVGRIVGPYSYRELRGVQHHTRPVYWTDRMVPLSEFGKDLQKSLNSSGTVRRIQVGSNDPVIGPLLDEVPNFWFDTTEGTTDSAETNVVDDKPTTPIDLDEPIIDTTVGMDETPINGTASNEPSEAPPYNLQDIITEGCFLEESKLETILNRLRLKKNLILQGPPGTGKTWLAKKLAFALLGQKDDSRVRRFQFHPNLSYEDFILGYRPNDESKLTLVEGPFLKAVTRAGDDQSNDYVIVIEEINRGNPAQIFGEMLTLLESDKRSPDEALRLAYSSSDADRTVHIPQNVYVIGTMNVADRSIALVDLALRRRFAFVDLEPVFGDVWRNWVHEQCGVPLDFLINVERRLTALNRRIADDRSLGSQFCVGHSYVTPTPGTQIDDPVEWFRDVVDTEIGPLLDEYWFDNASEAENAKSELLSDL